MGKQKNTERYIKHAILFLVFLSFYQCTDKKERTPETDSNLISTRSASYRSLEVVEIDGCQYVLWHNSYGSDMEHHGNCKNPIHNK